MDNFSLDPFKNDMMMRIEKRMSEVELRFGSHDSDKPN